MAESDVIHEVSSADGWNGMLEGFRLAFDSLAITYATAAKLAGLPDGYVGKLLSPIPVRQMGPTSFGCLMGAAAVRIVFVRDDAALAKLMRHGDWQKRNPVSPSRHTHHKGYPSASIPAKKKHKRRAKLPIEKARMLGCRRMLLLTSAQRSALARRANRIRWARQAANPPSP